MTNRNQLRETSPTGIVDDEERIARDLYRYYLKCGIAPDDALEKLAFILAMEPPIFTRMVPVLDELKGE